MSTIKASWIPIQKFKGEYGYPAEDAPVFANLDPEISVRGLKKNKDGSRLYLLYQRDGMYYPDYESGRE